MEDFHPLLRRQLVRHVPPEAIEAGDWQALLHAVSDAYGEYDVARRLVERALELSSAELTSTIAELRRILEIMPDLMFRVQSDGNLVGVTGGRPVSSHPLILRLSKAPGRTAAPVTGAFWKAVETVRETHATQRLEIDWDSEAGPASYEVRLLPFTGGDLIGIARDIADRRQAEQDRLVLGKLESTGVLAGGIAHDFNNLLTAMLLNVQGARHSGYDPVDVDRCFRETERCVFAAQALTQQLLAFARVGTSSWQHIVLTSVIEEAIPLALSGSNVRCRTTMNPAPWVVNADAGQITQLVRNLVLNAREAMPNGGEIVLTLENRVLGAGQVAALPPGDYVHIAVSDRGPGIPAELLSKIFDPYYSTKTRGAQKGMGLGLTICHSIVQRHAGAIFAESGSGAGSTFHVYLPACARHLSPAEPATEPAADGTAGRILVMDDEPMILTAFKHVLGHLGYEVEVAPDGNAAVERYVAARAAGHGFDAVMLDLTVRGEMGGLATLKVLQQHDPSVRAVMMSGYSGDQAMQAFATHGFRAALAKPCTEEAIRVALQKALSDGAPRR